MAKGSKLRLSDLEVACKSLGLNPIPTKNRINKLTGERYLELSKDDCIRALQEYYISEYKAQGIFHHSLDYILKIDSPMLALQIKNKPKEVQDEIWNNKEKWIAEEKIDGSRLNLCWFKEDRCLDAYSRNTSVKDFLPINYGPKLYDSISYEVLQNIPNFIIDGELVLSSNQIVKSDEVEVIADTPLNMVAAILSADYELSKKFQELNPVKLIVFDILMYDDNDLTNLPLKERKKYLDIIYDKLKGLINIEKVPNQGALSTEEYYNQIVQQGGEGLVVKDINSLYDTKGKRSGEWVKIKRTVTGSLIEEKYGDTFDAFVIGFNPGTKGTKNENLVGSLEFGIYLLDDNNEVIKDEWGTPIIHHIASVSGITDALRQNISTFDNEGNVVLKPQIYGAIGVLDAQDISDKNMRMTHARLLEWRLDKTPEQCTIRKDFLERLIL